MNWFYRASKADDANTAHAMREKSDECGGESTWQQRRRF